MQDLMFILLCVIDVLFIFIYLLNVLETFCRISGLTLNMNKAKKFTIKAI